MNKSYRKNRTLFRVIAFVLAFAVVSAVSIRLPDGSRVHQGGDMAADLDRGVVGIGVPEAEAATWLTFMDLMNWWAIAMAFIKGVVFEFIKEWVVQKIIDTINGKINMLRNFLYDVYHEASSILKGVERIKIFGGVSVGSIAGGQFSYVEDVMRASMKAVNRGISTGGFSIFSDYAKLPAGNDLFVYLGKAGNQSLRDIAKDLINRARDGVSLNSALEWMGAHSPYAPTTISMSDAAGIDAVKEGMARYTRMMVGDPIDISKVMKGMDPAVGQHLIKEAIRANVQKRLAVDVATEAAADVHYATQLEAQLKGFEGTPEDASLTTAIKDLNRLTQLNIHVNAKILKQLSQQSMVLAELASEMGEKRQQGAEAKAWGLGR